METSAGVERSLLLGGRRLPKNRGKLTQPCEPLRGSNAEVYEELHSRASLSALLERASYSKNLVGTSLLSILAVGWSLSACAVQVSLLVSALTGQCPQHGPAIRPWE